MSALISGLLFIIGIIFDSYIFVLLIRLILQKLGAGYHNPIIQFLLKVTNPIIKPFQMIIPGYKGIDYSIIVLVLILEIVELILIVWLKMGLFPGFLGTLIMSIGQLGNKLVNIFFFAAIIAAIMSWVPTLAKGPVAEIVIILSEPIFRPARRFIPVMSGIDLSPLVVIIMLKLISIVIFNPIVAYGARVASS